MRGAEYVIPTTTIALMTPFSQSQGGSPSPDAIPPTPRLAIATSTTRMSAANTAPKAAASSTPMRLPNVPLTAT